MTRPKLLVDVDNPADVLATVSGLRRRLGIPSTKLAAMMGCSQPRVSELERHSRRTPTLISVHRYLVSLGFDVVWILRVEE